MPNSAPDCLSDSCPKLLGEYGYSEYYEIRQSLELVNRESRVIVLHRTFEKEEALRELKRFKEREQDGDFSLFEITHNLIAVA